MARQIIGKKAKEFHDRQEPRKRLAYYLGENSRKALSLEVRRMGIRRR